MKVQTCAKSVVGATHIRKNPENPVCQDANYISTKIDGVTVIAVADGHGSEACKHSDEGAYRAVHAFTDVMNDLFSDFYAKYPEGDAAMLGSVMTSDNEHGLAKKIEATWRRRVERKHKVEKREILERDNEKIEGKKSSIAKANEMIDQSKLDFMEYGTTLLGVAIADDCAFVYQIGDGDIQIFTEDGVRSLVDADKFLGVETYSLAHDLSWSFAKTTMVPLKDIKKPFLIMMSTDGLNNSYINSKEFETCCKDYFEIIRDEGFKTVEKELEGWLRDTSDNGCGDDVTVALAYFSED